MLTKGNAENQFYGLQVKYRCGTKLLNCLFYKMLRFLVNKLLL